PSRPEPPIASWALGHATETMELVSKAFLVEQKLYSSYDEYVPLL
ncbi:hypothetical protein A2U01_0115265, partial [Trifolium medium]|nr:hypothetical protein [Trifolium medium]